MNLPVDVSLARRLERAEAMANAASVEVPAQAGQLLVTA